MGAKANIIIDQGADYSTVLTVTNDDGTATDLDGYTAAGEMRKHYTSSTAAATFVISFSDDRSDGLVTISLPRSTTTNIPAGRYVYDVEITSAGDKRTRLVEGIATVTPQVTQ
jgi:hypothetical protein